MIERLQVIAQRLADHRDAVLDQLRRLSQGERIALDCVRGVGQIDIERLLERPQRLLGNRTQRV
ncbi:MAG: hypothetical protein SFV18_13165 [Bryobacteraceae bacterium]|nr:hypothetical protein [Bryobacteraceae bacterium]